MLICITQKLDPIDQIAFFDSARKVYLKKREKSAAPTLILVNQ